MHIARFSFGFELFWGQSYSFTLYQRSAENGWLLTYIRLPHSTALFMTSLAQAAGHKMATFERRILTNSTRNRMKNRYVSVLYSIAINKDSDDFSFRSLSTMESFVEQRKGYCSSSLSVKLYYYYS